MCLLQEKVEEVTVALQPTHIDLADLQMADFSSQKESEEVVESVEPVYSLECHDNVAQSMGSPTGGEYTYKPDTL